MANKSTGTVIKKIMSASDAKTELQNYITEIAEIMMALDGSNHYDRVSNLIWIAKTGEKVKLRDMDVYHILAAIRTMSTRETSDIVTGKLPGFSVKAMAITLLKIELARRYTVYMVDSDKNIDRWTLPQVVEAITEIPLAEGIRR